MSLPTKISFETDPRGGILQEWTCHGYLTALRALDVEIVSPEQRFFAAAPADAGRAESLEIAITCVDPTAERRSAWRGERRDGEYAICILPHGRIPEHLIASGTFSRFDEIWTASAPLAAALAIRLPIPVVQIMPVVTAGGYLSGLRKSRTAEERFTIVAAIDLFDLQRSDRPIAILEAFKRAFERDENATMIIRCDGADACRDGLERLRLEIGGYPIIAETETRGTEGAMKLMATADVCLSLGQLDESSIEIAHAMAIGLPVVATGSPGNLAFLSPWNSFPVHAESVATERAAVGSPLLLCECEPSIEHAGRLLRYLYENREDGILRGERARHDISAWHSVGVASTAIGRRLETIAGIIESSRRSRSPQPADIPARRGPAADPLVDRLGDLETRMAELAAREEELRNLIGDLRTHEAPTAKPYLPPAKAEPPPPSPLPKAEPRTETRPTSPSSRQNGSSAPEPEKRKEREAEPPPPFRATDRSPTETPQTRTSRSEPPPPEPDQPDALFVAGTGEISAVVREARKALMSVTPFNTVVIVISGGIDDYLQLEGRTGWHYPQTSDGRHSELLPDNATRAINALEALKNRGAHYLLIPAPSFWWLSLFPALGGHLDQQYRRVWGDEQCIIYHLADPTAPAAAAPDAPAEKSWKMFKRK